jgi:hypothetical protein
MAQAQPEGFERDCKRWIDQRGYSTDYVERRIGKRQPGPAYAWHGNLAVTDIEPGDVVLTKLNNQGAMHAAVIEQLRRTADGALLAMRVSEWNWGKTIDERCLVTDRFGQTSTTRWIPIQDAAQAWRPPATN